MKNTFVVMFSGLMPEPFSEILTPFGVVHAETLDEAITIASDYFTHRSQEPACDVVKTTVLPNDFHQFDVIAKETSNGMVVKEARHQVHVLPMLCLDPLNTEVTVPIGQ